MKPIIEQLVVIWRRRELVKYFVYTDFKSIYKNKMLGFLWLLLDPLMMMSVYIVLISFIFKRGGPQFPVLLFCALLSWKWFTYAIESSVKSISARGKLIQSIHFPKTVLPLSRVIIGFLHFAFGLAMLVPLLFVFEARFSLNVLWLPVLVGVQFVLTFGAALICAALGVYFRDLENILQFCLRLLFYLSPALYSVVDRVPARFIPVYMLNPFAVLFESYKNVFVRGLGPQQYLLGTAVAAFIVLAAGLTLFHKKDSEFAKDV